MKLIITLIVLALLAYGVSRLMLGRGGRRGDGDFDA